MILQITEPLTCNTKRYQYRFMLAFKIETYFEGFFINHLN